MLGLAILTLAATPCSPSPCLSQQLAERYEMGVRLLALEGGWYQHESEASRRRALPHLHAMLRQYMAGEYSEAARSLDLARLALEAEDPPSPVRLWAASIQVRPEHTVADAGGGWTLHVSHFYPPRVEAPEEPHLSLEVRGPGMVGEVLARTELGGLPAVLQVPAVEVGRDFDFDAFVGIRLGGELVERRDLSLSCIEDPGGSVAELEKRFERLAPDPSHALERATIRGHLDLLAPLVGGELVEGGLEPALRFREAELLVTLLEHDRRIYRFARLSRLYVPVTGRVVPVRLERPWLESDEEMPLVLALHGAGGNEDMFFEAYGRGWIRVECERRGWMLVSPRASFTQQPPLPELIAALCERYPIDKERIFVVGHSMGAMQAWAAAKKHPGLFRAMALVSASGALASGEDLGKTAFFLAAGEEDFSRDGTVALQEALVEHGGNPAELRIVPATEHLTVMQTVLPEVFRFFDRHAGPK